MRRVALVALFCATTSTAAGCGSGRPDGAAPLRILAAASLTEAFTDIAEVFERAHPGVDVILSFAGSPAVVRQVESGAPVDVVALADLPSMERLENAKLVRTPVLIARNRLALIVPRGNPRRIAGLRDLADPDNVVVLCDPAVPCGRLAASLLARADVTVEARSLEDSVKGVVAKVGLGEADAGLVYATDARSAADRVEAVPVDGTDDPDLEAVYPAAAVVTTRSAYAERWLSYLGSTQARSVLTRRGFLIR